MSRVQLHDYPKDCKIAFSLAENVPNNPYYLTCAHTLYAYVVIFTHALAPAARIMQNYAKSPPQAANQLDAQGQTALMLACKKGHTACTQVLLDL